MRPNSRQLAMRDRALAAFLGVIGTPGQTFGGEGAPKDATFAGDFFGAEFGTDYGAEFGDYWGADAAPAQAAAMQRAMHPANPANLAKMQALLAKHTEQAAHTSRRERVLEPNKGSTIKVERYDFSLNQTLTLGTTATLNMTQNPDVTIRPQRLVTNAPSPGFCIFNNIKVANVAATVGSSTDAYSYSPSAWGSMLDLPTLSPANRATITGSYSGFVPPGFVGGNPYTFVATFQGPATIVGQ